MLFRVRTSRACTCKRVTQFKDKQCGTACTWCKWIGLVQTTCTWRPLLETCEIKQVNKPSAALRTRETHGDWERKDKREKIKWSRDVKWSWRVSCTVCRVQPLSDIFNKEAWAAVHMSALRKLLCLLALVWIVAGYLCFDKVFYLVSQQHTRTHIARIWLAYIYTKTSTFS